MESIHLNALFHSDEHKWNELYQSLYNSPLTHVLAFDIHPAKSQRHYPAFFYYTEELMQTTISLMSQMNELTKIANRIPAIAIEAFQRACLIEEIKSSNDIEGVNSTRKEISQALDAQDNISVAETTRLWSTVNKYIKLQNKQDISFSNSSDLRKFYDEFILDEIRRDDPKNIPDGEIFRKNSVEVWSKTKVIHRGVFPERRIIDSMDKALAILHDSQIPNLVRVAIFHYLFGYIHPFYDGNGRTSRFITSFYLARILSPLVAIRLSITIKKSLRMYYKLFEETNSYGNRGDLTPFITGFLWIIEKSIVRVKEDLKEKERLLEEYSRLLERLEAVDNRTDKSICYVLLQAALFSEDGATLAEIAGTLRKNERTIKTHINNIPSEYVCVDKSHRAHRFKLNLESLPLIASI
ncbi:Fic family protein [Selenomonas sp. WCT3]|uniref:Fic family protein n=1 Tax=Selenomonas sp. WCT3 TaxID=3158785 RepID=UPI00087FE003|nr:Fic family protein [Selenomonas ruminantium]